MKFSFNIGFFILTGLLGLIKWTLNIQTVKKQDWTEFSWRNNVYNAKFSLETRLEHGFGIEYTYLQWL